VTRGVEALASLLTAMAEEPGVTVAQVAGREGIARSTAFDIMRRLEAAGLATRGTSGGIAPGPQAVALGFAGCGVPWLHGPGEAALVWLKDTLGMAAAFGVGETELAALPARGRAPRATRPMRMEAGAAWIEVQVPADASEQLVEAAKRNLRRAAALLTA